MPTINEVWEQALQINANLAILHNDELQTNAWLAEIRTLDADGFSALATGIIGVHQRQDLTNALLQFQIQQNQTIICELEHISRNTCAILNEAARQTTLQEKISASVRALDEMFATANPGVALAYLRAREQQAALERCCPPERAADPCAYAPCPVPKPAPLPDLPRYAGYHPGPSRVARADDRPIG